jgi:hypothetical protein
MLQRGYVSVGVLGLKPKLRWWRWQRQGVGRGGRCAKSTKKNSRRDRWSVLAAVQIALEWARTINLRFRSSPRLPFAFRMLAKTQLFAGFLLLQAQENPLPKRRKRELVGGLVGGL